MLTFILAVLLLCITPGPGVLSLAGTGAAFGWRPGLKYMFGLWVGHSAVSIAVISGLAAIILAEPVFRLILLFICAGYFGYLSLRIAFAKSQIAFIKMAAPGFFTGVTLQLINPKAYAVHTILFGGFVINPGNFFLEVVYKQIVLNFCWIPVHLIWLYMGFRLSTLNLAPHIQNKINLGMAICLIFVVIISVWSVLVQ